MSTETSTQVEDLQKIFPKSTARINEDDISIKVNTDYSLQRGVINALIGVGGLESIKRSGSGLMIKFVKNP